MGVEPGYKPTEAGMIPADWLVQSLGELGSFKNGINKAAQDFGHGSPFINLMDVFGIPRAAATTENLGLVNSTLAEQQTYELRAGDVLFVRSSVKPEGVGLTTLIPSDLPKTVFSGFLIRFRDRGQLAREFKEHCFLGGGFRQRLIASSTVSANTNINQDALKLLQIAFPPSRDEQRAIATSLTDVDALLGALDRLIAKKRDLKQAAMQQLLTGQIRLPGFRGEWEVKRLGELAKIQRGASPRPIDSPVWFDENSSIGWVRISDVTSSGTFLRRTTQQLSLLGVKSSRPVATGSLIMSICATVGRPIITKIDVCIHDGFVVFDDLEADQLFVYYVLKWIEPDWSKQGQTGSQMNLNTGLINGTQIKLPPRDEQNAIASVLSDMDAELSALEGRRDKTRALKQGMMQALLTGKTRLIAAGGARA